MRKIYVCSPLRGDVAANIEKAKGYCREIALAGDIPVCPHIYCTQFLDDAIPQERQIGIAIGLEVLKICDELWIFGDQISEGMAREIEATYGLRIPVSRGDL